MHCAEFTKFSAERQLKFLALATTTTTNTTNTTTREAQRCVLRLAVVVNGTDIAVALAARIR